MKITIRNLQKKIPVNPKRVRLAIRKTLSLQGIKKSGEITVCFVNDWQIRELNLRYLNKNEPTDVIAFDITNPEDIKNNIFADIAVSVDRAIHNARIFKTTPLYELYFYIIHGLLHLLGYNDETAKQRREMDAKAHRIISVLRLNG